MKKSADKTMVVLIYHAIRFGGIGTYIYKMIKNLLKQGACVVWIKQKKAQISAQHAHILSPEKITIFNDAVDYKVLNQIIDSRGIKEIKVISFSPIPFTIGEEIKRKLSKVRVDNFYFVPHFTGGCYYLEEFFVGRKAQKVKEKMAKIFKKMNDNSNLLFFAQAHIDKMRDTYGLKIGKLNEVQVPHNKFEELEFDKERVKRVYNREHFNIIAVSRLEFPHKGFVKGLLKEFFRLKNKYPQITLTIVGDGPNRTEIEQEIEKNKEFASSVILTGNVSPDELYKYYDESNINISVAGCFLLGAERGVLSCPARHYSYDCEVYGFSSEKKDFSLDTSPGLPVSDFIEKVINMSEEEYMSHCYDSFCIYQQRKKDRAASISVFDIKNISTSQTLSKADIRFMRNQNRAYISKYIAEAQEDGLIKPITKRIKRILNLQ